MAWLYEPYKIKNPVYDLPIHSEDAMLPCFTYQQIIDETIANYGHDVDETILHKQVKDHLNMLVEEMWEGFDLCKKQMLKEIRRK